MTQRLLSIGHGFSGQATERALGPDWQVLGTSRTPGAAAVLWPDGLADALATAIAAEDYALAAVIRDRFADLVGDGAPGEGGPRRRSTDRSS